MVHKGLGIPVPAKFEVYLGEHPRGVENGYGPRLWTAQAIRDETDDRGISDKGVCIIGPVDDTRHILLRARDGKIFIVDPMDYRTVDAWFSDINSLVAYSTLNDAMENPCFD